MSDPADRAVKLGLTVRWAEMLRSLASRERKRAIRQQQKNQESGWRPKPGQYDATEMRINAMDDIVRQLDAQLAQVKRRNGRM